MIKFAAFLGASFLATTSALDLGMEVESLEDTYPEYSFAELDIEKLLPMQENAKYIKEIERDLKIAKHKTKALRKGDKKKPAADAEWQLLIDRRSACKKPKQTKDDVALCREGKRAGAKDVKKPVSGKDGKGKGIVGKTDARKKETDANKA